MASASAESGPTLRKPELATKPVVREAPAEHEAAEKLSSPSAPAALASYALSALSTGWSMLLWPDKALKVVVGLVLGVDPPSVSGCRTLRPVCNHESSE